MRQISFVGISVGRFGKEKKMRHISLIGVLALVFALGLCTSARANILFDDFDDDSGILTGETANTGQTWLAISGRTALDIGTQFGQSGNGAGNDLSGTADWKANEIALGEIVNDGTIIVSADFRKQHVTSPVNEMNISLKSSTQAGKETALIWSADWLKIGGGWTFGGAEINTGVPTDIHVELTLNLVAGGTNSVAISFYEIGNPANAGSVTSAGSIDGTLNYDTLTMWAYTDSGKILGFDNVSIVPEPATLVVLGSGALFALLRRRR